jgi:hypothetical protein
LQFANITTDSLNPSPITFNENKYSIFRIFLNVYSWGIYSISPCCEIVMVCISSSGVLIICIPVAVTPSSQSVAIPPTIPSGEITSSDIYGVSLNNYFPTTPSSSFIYYQAPYSTESTNADYIVFPNSTLTIASTTVATIVAATGNTTTQYQSNISGKTAKYISGIIYYNANGIGTTPSSDEIYIECNPTDYSGSQLVDTPNSPTIKNNASYSPSIVWFIICGVIVLVILALIVSKLYKKLTGA